MKRLLKQLPIFMLALVMCLQIFLPAVQPAEARYNYTVRIYAGQQGTISGGEYVEYPGLNYGDRVNFNLRDVQLKDGSKYYVKGIRPAGRDNNTVGMTSFPVQGDADWVIAYGLLTDAVMYTIEYVDTAGNELAPSEHYYGNVGDKPVIAFLYIEGYRPNAYNLTGTLQADASKNIFRFVYTRITGNEPAEGDDNGPGTTPTTPTRPTTPTGTPQQPGQDTGERPNINPGGIPVVPAQNQNNGDDGGNGDNGDTVDINDENVPLNETEEIFDLDEPEVPLNNFVEIMNEAHILGVPVWAELVLLLFIIAAVAYGIWYINEKRKERR